MKVYAESSAVLAWLLGESKGRTVQAILAAAEVIICSDLTLIECDRVLIRAHVQREISEAGAADCRAILQGAAAHWNVLRLGPEIVERARRPFHGEPIRTLDAIHLASALVARSAISDLGLLSLDDRVREAGRLLGMNLFP